MAMVLQNAYWHIELSLQSSDGEAGCYVEKMAFDAEGRSQWCGNLLKSRNSLAQELGLAQLFGAQSGYFAQGRQPYSSSLATGTTVSQGSRESATVENIVYGHVKESWHIRLNGKRLMWTVEQEWLEATEVEDLFVPGIFFAARQEYGGATVFQLWDTDMAQDDYYRSADQQIVNMGVMPVSRSCGTRKGQTSIAKLLSAACPKGDLRVTVDHHLKKGEHLNTASVLAQTLACEPLASPLAYGKGERSAATIILEPEAESSGYGLGVQLEAELEPWSKANQRFYDNYINCGMLADTQRWCFGNEPSGYVALFCQYMYAEMVKYGVPYAPLGDGAYYPVDVLRREVGDMAASLIATGTVGTSYQERSYDLLPSFLLAARDLLLITGDRALAGEVFPAMVVAWNQLYEWLNDGGGLIESTRSNENDYWDWIIRNGFITSVNVLVYASLCALAETAEWLGESELHQRVDQAAKRMADRFNEMSWDEEAGCYADWVDRAGNKFTYFYAGSQLLGITAGIVPLDRAVRLLDTIEQRRQALGEEWMNCFSLQTNFYDVQPHSLPLKLGFGEVMAFGQTMNGGCLVSWNYYWIGALVKAGRYERALEVWQQVLERYKQSSLIEGSNYWDYAGRPSRTTAAHVPFLAWEPFLSDQGLVAASLPHWLMGVELTFHGVSANPVLAQHTLPESITVMHLGDRKEIKL